MKLLSIDCCSIIFPIWSEFRLFAVIVGTEGKYHNNDRQKEQKNFTRKQEIVIKIGRSTRMEWKNDLAPRRSDAYQLSIEWDEICERAWINFNLFSFLLSIFLSSFSMG
jgi:hypothetical protein